MGSDRRAAQQAGWVWRTFEGATTTTTLPPHRGPRVEVVYGDFVSEMGENLLGSMLSAARLDWSPLGPETGAGDATYRVLVGKKAITPWVDLQLQTMRGRIGYWKNADRVVCVVDHPDSVLAAGEGKRARITTNTDALKLLGRIVRGEIGALDVMALDCVKCAEDGVLERNVTEMDVNGLGLCRTHSGFDVRPEVQRWQQETMFNMDRRG